VGFIAFSIHRLICCSLKVSELGRALDGSSRWHTGHSSSSAIRGGRGSGPDIELAQISRDQIPTAYDRRNREIICAANVYLRESSLSAKDR